MAKIGVLKCQACGAGLLDGARSCTRCGAMLPLRFPEHSLLASQPENHWAPSPPLFPPIGADSGVPPSTDSPRVTIAAKRMRSVEGGVLLPVFSVALLLVGSLVAALTLGSSEKTGGSRHADIPTTKQIKVSTTQAAPLQKVGGHWKINGSSQNNGGTMSVEVFVGEPHPYQGGIADNGVNLNGCRGVFDSNLSSSIGVFPVTLKLTNTSVSVDDAPFITLGGAGPSSHSTTTMAYGSDGYGAPICEAQPGGTWTCSERSLQPPSQSKTCLADILLTNFYKTDGSVNFAAPSEAVVVVNSIQEGNADSFSVDRVSAKKGGQPLYDNNRDAWLLPLGTA